MRLLGLALAVTTISGCLSGIGEPAEPGPDWEVESDDELVDDGLSRPPTDEELATGIWLHVRVVSQGQWEYDPHAVSPNDQRRNSAGTWVEEHDSDEEHRSWHRGFAGTPWSVVVLELNRTSPLGTDLDVNVTWSEALAPTINFARDGLCAGFVGFSARPDVMVAPASHEFCRPGGDASPEADRGPDANVSYFLDGELRTSTAGFWGLGFSHGSVVKASYEYVRNETFANDEVAERTAPMRYQVEWSFIGVRRPRDQLDGADDAATWPLNG